MPPGPHVLRHQPGQGAFELLGGRRLGEVGDPLDRVTQQAHVTTGERQHQVDDGSLLDRVETTDGAEVDEPEGAVGQGEDVAGMGVGMEQPDAHDLIERRPQQLIRQRRSIHGSVVEMAGVGDGEALEALLHEHPSPRHAAKHLRDADGGPLVQHHRHLGHGVGLVAEVELGPQPVGELAEHLTGADALSERRAALGEVGEQGERSEVALHQRLDVGALHLDDDGLAGVQPCLVRLTDRRGGERLPVELCEDLLDGSSELGFEDGCDALLRFGLDPVL